MELLSFKNACMDKKDEQGNSVQILENITVTINQGDIFAVAGPSGAGKSSMLRLVNRLDDSSCGEILLEGRSLYSWDIGELRDKVGFVFQESSLFPGTVIDNLLYGLRLRGLKRVEEETRALELLKMVGLPEDMLHKSVENLSGGQKQRVNLGRTLALAPEIILMDEPTSALDPAAARLIENLIVQLNRLHGKTILLVSHNLNQIERIASRCAILEAGKIVFSGTREEFFANRELLDRVMNGKGETENA